MFRNETSAACKFEPCPPGERYSLVFHCTLATRQSKVTSPQPQLALRTQKLVIKEFRDQK